MTIPFTLRLYDGNDCVSETECTSLVLEREIYTPYSEMAAVFLSDGQNYGNVDRIELLWGSTQVFLGLADSITQFRKNGCLFTKVRSRSFTALLAQNELRHGTQFNITIKKLVNDFCHIPYVACEDDPAEGYIHVRDGTNLWDCIVCFGYKLKHHYPYVVDHKICLSPPDSEKVHTIASDQVLEYGTAYDTTKIVSHFHMEDFDGTQDRFQEINQDAVGGNIIRHKWLSFDQQFLYVPQEALTFRKRFSMRGSKAKYLAYEGFANENLGERIRFGQFLQDKVICRVRVTFGQNGLCTKIWAYEDGFYQ